ncbi:MAG: M23 family metallopeptidase [Spirochaetales bacterium]|nr:M23 family metallopeptidase [Spirochaetales bacterium]
MKKKFSLIIFLFGFIVALCAESGIQVAGSLEPGSVLAVFTENEVGFAEGTLFLPSGGTVHTQGFFWPEESERTGTIFLFGIPSQTTSGEALIRVQGVAGGVPWTVEEKLRLGEKTFREETIPLTEALTNLREEEREAREKESLELYNLLITFQAGSFYDGGPYARPFDGGVMTSWFGDRRRYEYHDGRTATSVHAGIDLAATRGTAVHACGAGRVVLSKNRIITGETIVLEHLPGVYSLYYHLEKRFVNPGDLLEKGQLLGTVGMTGFATGPHLHWEFRVAGVPVDPEPLVLRGLLDKVIIMSIMDDKN